MSEAGTSSPRLTFYAGSWYWPVTAIIAFFGPASFFLSLFVAPDLIPGPIGAWLHLGLVFFFVAGLFCGVIGFLSIVSCGLSTVGRLSIRGHCLYGKRLGVTFLLMYLPACLIVAVAVVAYSLSW